MTTKEQIEIIQAYERGEEIEFKLPLSGWYTLGSKEEFIEKTGWEYKFNFFNVEYRIKSKPNRWRAEKGEVYYYINVRGVIATNHDYNTDFDNDKFSFGNYFHTKEQAQKARELVKETLTKFHEEND